MSNPIHNAVQQVPIINDKELILTKSKEEPYDPIQLGSGSFGVTYAGTYQGSTGCNKKVAYHDSKNY